MPRRQRNQEANALEMAIEVFVAGRIRLRRGMRGMSQSDLARALGITFQQVQKYERGSNRVSVGKLYRLADILDVPMSYFFEGLGTGNPGGTDVSQSPMLSRRELDLLRVWSAAPVPVADEILGLLRALSPAGADQSEQSDVEVRAPSVQLAAIEAAVASQPPPPSSRRGRPKSAGKPDQKDRKVGATRRRHPVWDPSDIRQA